MKGEKIIALVKELESIKSIRSRNSYLGAWCGFIVAIVWIANLYMQSMKRIQVQGLEWFSAFLFLIALILLLQSFFLIIRHITNKKLAVIIEALLESNKHD